MIGGTCNLFINDDGLNGPLDKDLAEKRRKYYKLGNIGYVGRPKKNRAGLFKKASNLNYCIDVSCKVMAKMKRYEAEKAEKTESKEDKVKESDIVSPSTNELLIDNNDFDNDTDTKTNNSDLTESKNTELEDALLLSEKNENCSNNEVIIDTKSTRSKSIKHTRFAVNAPPSSAMKQALREVREEKNREFIAGGDITIGDIVLLLDADTRLGEKCIFQTVGEFKDEHVAFTQHHTRSMRVDFNYWENVIAFFTNHVYDIGISEACALGDVSPLVGHNAMLRVRYVLCCVHYLHYLH